MEILFTSNRVLIAIKDLIVDRSSLTEYNKPGGFISVNTGNTQDANAQFLKMNADVSFDAMTLVVELRCYL